MHITYSVSLWNYFHYANQPSLERVIAQIRNAGYGIELWGSCWNEPDLYDEVGRERLKPLVEGMTVSLHTKGGGALDFERHRKQIDTAAAVGAGVIVLHGNDVYTPEPQNWEIIRRAVDYAGERGVKLAYENGGYEPLVEAFENVPGLFCCIDVGHIYLGDHPGTMKQYCDAFCDRLIHLHLQDLRPQAFDDLPLIIRDHYCSGTGAIPREEWEVLGQTLRRIDFNGIAAFEIHPEYPLDLVTRARGLVGGILES